MLPGEYVDLIADIGATNARCALVDHQGCIVGQQQFKNADFDTLEALLWSYITGRRSDDKPRNAAIGVAAPILGDQVRMLNLDWEFSQQQLCAALQLNRLTVVNDFAAVARSLPLWEETELYHLGGGEPIQHGTLAALGPGSGLGVTSLVRGPEGWNVVAGEGGHMSLAANDAQEAELINTIRSDYGHCSAERILSGPGLVLLYEYLARQNSRKAVQLTAEEITALAVEGNYLARETLAQFFRFLGSVAGNLALTVGATGGVFIAGGIVPQLLDPIADSDFRARFEAKGRYQGYLEQIPTAVILDPAPALRGLQRILGYWDTQS
jgi:glucokinase